MVAGAEPAIEASAPLVQMLRDKEAAEAANAAKSRHLVSISHEFRSPLNVIYGYAQLVERGDGVSPKEAARVIRRSTEHLTSLIEGLLDISLVENGVLSVKSDTVRLAPFLDQIASMFRPGAEAKGLSFEYEIRGRLPEFVRMDQKRVRQVLINLLSNAIKFTVAGSVILRVSYAAQTAVLEVIDTGPGIAPDDHDKIFAPFDRGTSARAEAQPGSGLGLSITKTLVQILGGNLEMESKVGSGTCFRVTMMMSHVAGQMLDAVPVRRVTGYTGERRSILVVDDDIQQLALMRNLLESIGFDVAVAPSGETAIEAGRTTPFDLTFLDISMPGMSGWETARHLRAKWGPSCRIVMLSANTNECRRPGSDDTPPDLFIAKPFEIDAVVDAIGDLLELDWQWEAPGQSKVQPAPIAGPDETLPQPAWLHIERLQEHVRIGHVRGIEAEIKALAEAAPDAGKIIARLYESLDRFDLAGLADILDSLGSKKHV